MQSRNIIADSDFVVRIGIFRAFRLARIVAKAASVVDWRT